MTENTNTELVVADNAPATVGALAQTVMSNFDNAPKSTVYNALNNALSLSKDAPETIALEGIICKPGTRAVSGEPCVDTYLVDTDGEAYFTQSTGVGKCAADLLAIYGGNVRGLVVAVEEKEIGGGRTMKSLRVISES